MRRERGFGVNPWRTHSRFLVSHNLLIDSTYADPLREWLGPMLPGSLLILDEAHHAAPSSGGRYGIETKFTRADPRPLPAVSSTVSSSPRRRTTATRTASPRSSSFSIRTASPAA